MAQSELAKLGLILSFHHTSHIFYQERHIATCHVHCRPCLEKWGIWGSPFLGNFGVWREIFAHKKNCEKIGQLIGKFYCLFFQLCCRNSTQIQSIMGLVNTLSSQAKYGLASNRLHAVLFLALGYVSYQCIKIHYDTIYNYVIKESYTSSFQALYGVIAECCLLCQ